MTLEEIKLNVLYLDRDRLSNDIIVSIDGLKTDNNKEELDVLFELITDLKTVCEKIGKFEQLTIKG